MASYKLTYFNLKARAEVSRMLFAIAGVEYEDIRITREEWPEFKKTTPFGQVPLLEVDGRVLCQSRVIEAFLARRFGLAGDSDWDQARAAMINDCLEDVRAQYRAIYRQDDEDKKIEMRKTFENITMINHLDNFEKMVEENNGADGYFVGEKMTYADVAFYHHTYIMPIMGGVQIDWNKWPKLKTLREKVETHPRLVEWFAKRPQTYR